MQDYFYLSGGGIDAGFVEIVFGLFYKPVKFGLFHDYIGRDMIPFSSIGCNSGGEAHPDRAWPCK